MRKSLLLLASFAGLVACFGDDKKAPEGQEGQTTEEACPAATPEAAPAAEATVVTPAVEAAPASESTAESAEHHHKK